MLGLSLNEHCHPFYSARILFYRCMFLNGNAIIFQSSMNLAYVILLAAVAHC